jgi:hypothetical protein
MQFYTNATSADPAGTAGGAKTFGGLPHPRDNSAVTETEVTGWRFLSPPTITQNAFGRFNATVQLELIG